MYRTQVHQVRDELEETLGRMWQDEAECFQSRISLARTLVNASAYSPMRQLCALAALGDLPRLQGALEQTESRAAATQDFLRLARMPVSQWAKEPSALFREVAAVFEIDDCVLESPETFMEEACMLNAVCAGALGTVRFFTRRRPFMWCSNFTEDGGGMLTEAVAFACSHPTLEAPVRGIEELLSLAMSASLEKELEAQFPGGFTAHNRAELTSDDPCDQAPRALAFAVSAGHWPLREVLQTAGCRLPRDDEEKDADDAYDDYDDYDGHDGDDYVDGYDDYDGLP